jgi:hypothetical protein
MIYLGIIAILLGLISVFITINYMKYTDKMLRQIKYIRNKCIVTSNINKKNESTVVNLVNKIQRESNLSLEDIYHIVLTYQHTKYDKSLNKNDKTISEEEIIEEEIIEEEIIEEEFTNFKSANKNNKFFYTNTKTRGINNTKNFNLKNLTKMLDINKVKELSEILTNYRSLFDRTFERIKTITDNDIDSLDTNKVKVLSTNKNSPLTCSKNLKNLQLPLQKLQFCQQNYHGKKYCFRVPKKSLCSKGKIVTNTKKCDFY